MTLNNSFLDLLTCNVRDYYGGNKDIVSYCIVTTGPGNISHTCSLKIMTKTIIKGELPHLVAHELPHIARCRRRNLEAP